MLSCPICGEVMAYDNKTSSRREMYWSRCMDCGFSTVFPKPSKEEIETYYSSGEYLEEVGTGTDARWAEGQHRARNWNNMVPADCKSHLDFGAGLGSTLYEMRVLHPSIEISHGCDIAGEQTYRDLIEPISVGGKFDMVTAFQTLEHVKDVKTKICQLKMVTGKILMIEVPVWGRVWPHIHNFTVESFEKMGFESEMGRAAIYAHWRRNE